MLNDKDLNLLTKTIENGEQAKKLLDKQYELTKDIEWLENKVKQTEKCCRISFNNGYGTTEISLNEQNTSAEHIKMILREEIAIKRRELINLNLPTEFSKEVNHDRDNR